MTFTVSFTAESLGLPDGGWVTLDIFGDGVDYSGKSFASADGNVYFTVPMLPVGAIVSVTLTAYDGGDCLKTGEFTAAQK